MLGIPEINNGSYSYSPIRPVIFNDEFTWQLYPNPSKGVFNFLFQANNGEPVAVQVYDANGKTVSHTIIKATGFMQKTIIDLSGAKYAGGIYLVQTESGGVQQFFKVIKQ